MSRIVSVTGSVNTTTVSITVNGAPGGAGNALAYMAGSISATLVNTSATAGFEYKVNSSAWKFVGRNAGAQVAVNFAVDKMYFRQTAGDLSLTSVEINVDSVPSIYAKVGDAVLEVVNATRNPNTVAIIGDSKPALWHSVSALSENMSSRGFITWWLASIGQCLSVAGDFSTGGSRFGPGGNLPSISSQIDLAIATGAGWLLMEGGVNDITGGTSLSDLQDAQLIAVNKATAAGMKVIWANIAPLINPTSGYTATQQALIMNQNRWIKDRITPPNGKSGLANVYLWDYYASAVNPADAAGNAIAGYYVDGIHEATVGAYNESKSLAALTLTLMPKGDRLLTSNVDSKTFNPNSTNLYDNGLFINGSGTATGFAVGGAAAAGATKTLVARADGFGNDQTLTFTTVNSGDGIILNCPNVVSLGAVGKTYVVECEITLASPVNLNQLSVTMSAIGNLATQTSTWCGDVASTMYAEDLTVTVRTFPMTVSAAIGTMSQLKAAVSCTSGAAAGSGVLKVGRLSFREIT